jgi:hypothetical protein
LEDDVLNMERQLQRSAMIQSSQYIYENTDLSKKIGDRYELMKLCLKMIPPSGLKLEFGVYRGNSIRFIAEQVCSRRVFGFDSFEGLSEAWGFAPKALFDDLGQLTRMAQNVTLIRAGLTRRFQLSSKSTPVLSRCFTSIAISIRLNSLA